MMIKKIKNTNKSAGFCVSDLFISVRRSVDWTTGIWTVEMFCEYRN